MRSEAVREMTFEEEYEILQKEKERVFASEHEGYEPPLANCVLRRALRCIRKLQEQQPKTDWIPCEERLPSEKGFYLVTVKRGCNLEVLCIWYQKECWLCDQEEIGKIIAWSFLPQPYKKEGAE
jgi:hypothetical protein